MSMPADRDCSGSSDRPSQHFGELVRLGDHGRCVQAPLAGRRAAQVGPEIDTAATTRPDGPRTGADTEATPGSRSPNNSAPTAARRTADRAVAFGRPAVLGGAESGLLPRQEDLGGRSEASTGSRRPGWCPVAPSGARRPRHRCAGALAQAEQAGPPHRWCGRATRPGRGPPQPASGSCIGCGRRSASRAEDEAVLTCPGLRDGDARGRRRADARSDGPDR